MVNRITMSEDKIKIELKVTDDGLVFPSDFSLFDYGFNEGEGCIITIDDETGEGKIQKICDALMDEIENYDDKLFKIVVDETEELTKQIASSKYPISLFSMISIIAGINSLKLGIFELCKNREIYSINVLYRSFLEHFIKINYFFYRLVLDKTDLVGEDYNKFYSKNEVAMYGKSIEQIRTITDLEYKGKNIAEIIYEIYPEFKQYSAKELKRKILQFNYKNMIKFIYDKQSKVKQDGGFNIILSIIPEYSDLSSFVHGGPYAINTTSKMWTDNEVELKCCQFARSTYSINIIVNLLFINLITAFVDKKYLSYYNRMNEVWKESSEKIEEYFKPFKKETT